MFFIYSPIKGNMRLNNHCLAKSYINSVLLLQTLWCMSREILNSTLIISSQFGSNYGKTV